VRHKRFETNAAAQRFIDQCAEEDQAELQEAVRNDIVAAAAAVVQPPPDNENDLGLGQARQESRQTNDIERSLRIVLANVIRSRNGSVVEQGQEGWTFQQVVTVFGITTERPEEWKQVCDAFYGQR